MPIFLVLVYGNITTYADYYAGSVITRQGYIGDVTGFLYKINMNDSVRFELYNNLWLDGSETEEIKKERKQRHESTVFPIEFLAAGSVQLVDGGQTGSVSSDYFFTNL